MCIRDREALAQAQTGLGGDAQTPEVGDLDGQAHLPVEVPEVARDTPHARPREDALQGPWPQPEKPLPWR
eukprot:140782-Alexandrium_andersonii.AAC.1